MERRCVNNDEQGDDITMQSKTMVECAVPGHDDQPATRFRKQSKRSECNNVTHPHADCCKYAVAVAVKEFVPWGSHAEKNESI